jgi:hypothetical protein
LADPHFGYITKLAMKTLLIWQACIHYYYNLDVKSLEED